MYGFTQNRVQNPSAILFPPVIFDSEGIFQIGLKERGRLG